jgi:alpha/beta superfamily hydrolase
MKPHSERCLIPGPAGRIEVVLEFPENTPQGLALIGHPHPLYRGTLENKVAATLARAFLGLGWIAARPNFRGVGASEGEHDHGHGETEDFVFLVDALVALPSCAAVLPAPPPLLLAGFSFGSFVAAGAAQALKAQGRPARALVLIGTAAGKWPVPKVDPTSIVIHGENDETVPLADVFTWARDSEVPVIVLPGADHFFHRRLTDLKNLVQRNLVGAAVLARRSAAGGGSGGHDD